MEEAGSSNLPEPIQFFIRSAVVVSDRLSAWSRRVLLTSVPYGTVSRTARSMPGDLPIGLGDRALRKI